MTVFVFGCFFTLVTSNTRKGFVKLYPLRKGGSALRELSVRDLMAAYMNTRQCGGSFDLMKAMTVKSRCPTNRRLPTALHPSATPYSVTLDLILNPRCSLLSTYFPMNFYLKSKTRYWAPDIFRNLYTLVWASHRTRISNWSIGQASVLGWKIISWDKRSCVWEDIRAKQFAGAIARLKVWHEPKYSPNKVRVGLEVLLNQSLHTTASYVNH